MRKDEYPMNEVVVAVAGSICNDDKGVPVDHRTTIVPAVVVDKIEQLTQIQDTPASASTSPWLAKYGGILFALLASIFFSLTFLDVKVLQNRGFPPFGTALLFNLGVILPAAVFIVIHDSGIGFGGAERKRQRILSEIWPLSDHSKRNVLKILTLQGLLQAASVVFRSWSLQYLDIGDMTVIVFSSPILTTIIAHFVVQEPCGIIFIFIAIYTFFGVVLITKPPMLIGGKEFDGDHLIGIALASGALICLSMKFVVTRKINKSNVFLMTLFLGVAGFLVSLPLYLIFEDWDAIIPNDSSSWLLVVCLFGAFCSIACINKALTMENAGPVALVRSLDVLFAFLLQFLFLNVVPDLLSSAGAIIVVSGVLAVGVRKWLVSTKYGQANCACCE